ncbi:Receptor-like cytosolic serine/threonine-protein kinase [Arachis hypogaea]|nr:Receptor-like cytosolic serine/threonine-protein kinase [Arachis hypogaea]
MVKPPFHPPQFLDLLSSICRSPHRSHGSQMKTTIACSALNPPLNPLQSLAPPLRSLLHHCHQSRRRCHRHHQGEISALGSELETLMNFRKVLATLRIMSKPVRMIPETLSVLIQVMSIYIDIPNSTSDSEALPGSGGSNANNQWHSFFKLLKKGSQMQFQPFHLLKNNVSKLTRRKSKRVRYDLIPSFFDSEFANFKSSWKNFTLSELQAATNDFSHDNIIGEGWYAEVYLGKLEDGTFVAIKKLTRGNQEEMAADFLSELGIMCCILSLLSKFCLSSTLHK